MTFFSLVALLDDFHLQNHLLLLYWMISIYKTISRTAAGVPTTTSAV
jgi:hypothetical protein